MFVTRLPGYGPVAWLGYNLDEIRERFPEIDQANIEELPDFDCDYDQARRNLEAMGYLVQ